MTQLVTPTLCRAAFAFDDFEVRTQAKERIVCGIVAPFDTPTFVGAYTEVFRKGAFTKTIQERGHKVKLLALHNEKTMPLGAARRLEETATGLYGEFKVSRTAAGDEALALIEDGAIDSFSVGFVPIPHRDQWSRDRSSVERHEVKLLEVSLVPFPAYADAVITAVRNATTENTTPLKDKWSRILATL